MQHPTDRRAVLMAAGAAAFAAAAGTGTGTAQSADVHGTIMFVGGVAIPEGQIEVYLEDLAIQDRAKRRIAEARIESDGASKTLGFAFPQPASPPSSPTLQIVARLERGDGWLLARGSAEFEPGGPLNVILKEAIY